ncbi:hypothetical protein SCOCK_580003 [Actinacidiphila cocklensis]|uniref:Uncharacterized protein n=1 Tax=Actinacidiphila cocklensis TaxID=887465 RepID=A0A9W4DX21_9ACTN|nr:hypothetical protein SCOCK_580003 [Actinacidiphila cocklensis]
MLSKVGLEQGRTLVPCLRHGYQSSRAWGRRPHAAELVSCPVGHAALSVPEESRHCDPPLASARGRSDRSGGTAACTCQRC